MPRGPEPSWEMRTAIWDLASKLGPKPEVILRDLQRLCRHDMPLESETPPDSRTVKRVIQELQTLKLEVLATLPRRIWHLREDYYTIRAELENLVAGGALENLPNVATQLKAQLFTLAPGDILIDDLGSLGDHDTRLRQDTLSVVLQSLGYTVGIKATVSTATWGVPRPREAQIFWHVFPNLSVERYCPAERDPLFQDWLDSGPSTLERDIAEWKRLEGSYLADAVSTRMKIHDAARQETRAWVAEGLIASLPRVFAPPPQPLTVNFGNLIYQLAIEYCRSKGARGLPDEACYDTMLGDHPPWVQLVLGQPRIPLGNPLPSLVPTWIDLHRKMIVEWGQSRDILTLLVLFKKLQNIEQAIIGMHKG